MIYEEAIRAIPTEGIGKDLRASGGGKASDMPWSGTCLAREGVVRRRLRLADHANADSIAREVANVRHQSKKENRKEVVKTKETKITGPCPMRRSGRRRRWIAFLI